MIGIDVDDYVKCAVLKIGQITFTSTIGYKLLIRHITNSLNAVKMARVHASIAYRSNHPTIKLSCEKGTFKSYITRAMLQKTAIENNYNQMNSSRLFVERLKVAISMVNGCFSLTLLWHKLKYA